MRQEVGSLIAAISGVLLVQVSAGGLQEVLQWPVRLVGILGFLGVLWYVLRRWRTSAPLRRPRSRREIRNYALWLGLILAAVRSEEHTSELQSHSDLVCRLLLE